MAEVTNELMFELMKEFHQRFDKLDLRLTEVKSELQSIRGHIASVNSDVHNIYGVLARYETRLDRIDRRLDLRELAEPSRSYDPHP